ncbi:MAG: enolase C-terminal domain-like protein [SAR202 cluster bacterium]|jgi:L-rhamnonate dehydratase|nr:enolase C-terminal domain-like protein [SAR202 cluster bacterium]MDP6715792.1 enolase C-terminal domain-like protein [SAR202 cluster bacterium]
MKIKEIKAVKLKMPPPSHTAEARRPPWSDDAEVANPMSRYPKVKANRNLWMPKWDQVACVVTAEDGTWGLGMTTYDAPVVSIINDHFAPILVGENCMAIEKLWDMMFRLASPYSATGLASYAISAVDLALWDLKGKILGKPVYELLGGPAREKIFCYATGNDTDWHMELRFEATKLACPYGTADGLRGLELNEELVAKTRELIGPNVELMLDCWMAFDLEFAVRLGERLRPYGLKWMEDCLIPEDFQGFAELRKRLPWMTLATGEHWYTSLPFLQAASNRVVDYLQPDILWVGGLTATVKICHIAEAAGIAVIPHGGMNDSYGQHASFAMPNIPWGECFVGSPPGVPLTEAAHRTPGMSVPDDGYLVPNDGPGFGIDLALDDIESHAG